MKVKTFFHCGTSNKFRSITKIGNMIGYSQNRSRRRNQVTSASTMSDANNNSNNQMSRGSKARTSNTLQSCSYIRITKTDWESTSSKTWVGCACSSRVTRRRSRYSYGGPRTGRWAKVTRVIKVTTTAKIVGMLRMKKTRIRIRKSTSTYKMLSKHITRATPMTTLRSWRKMDLMSLWTALAEITMMKEWNYFGFYCFCFFCHYYYYYCYYFWVNIFQVWEYKLRNNNLLQCINIQIVFEPNIYTFENK